MPTITRDQVRVPADVMPEARENYIENYMKATRGTGRLMLFACDQKIEHLNKDFYGEGIDPSDLEPEHLFEIGSKGTIGILAGQRGLIAQYANDYPEINYLVKMNSKTNLVKGAQDDPYSPQLYDLEAVLAMKDAGVNIVGIGYTIYLCSGSHRGALDLSARQGSARREGSRSYRGRSRCCALLGCRLREGQSAEGNRWPDFC